MEAETSGEGMACAKAVGNRGATGGPAGGAGASGPACRGGPRAGGGERRPRARPGAPEAGSEARAARGAERGRRAPGGPPGPAGWDRRRAGARLRAALAGLHELRGPRARQQARGGGALAGPPPPGPAAPRGPRAQELPMEAALAALQDQLDRLRRQDVGLQTHLDQLDRQISALQLDVRRGPGETADSDSRPSSGFYELSDGGSCSLSTSCTSVCSDHVSCSLGTLLPAAPKARPGSGDCRPRSADETAVCGVPLPAWGPPASEEEPGQLFQEEPRPRPVSTGDLERILPADVGLQKAGAHPTAAPFLCHGVDPKYQCDLVSRGGREVYPYPSPLHAVALQSPLFALARETPQSEGHAPPHPPPASPAGPSSVRPGLAFEAGPAAAYIERLLRLRACGSARGPPRGKASPAPLQLGARKVDGEGGLEKPACTPGRAVVSGAASGDGLARPPPTPSVGTPRPSSHPEGARGPCHGHVHLEACPDAPQLACGRAPAPRCPAQPSVLAGWPGGGRWPSGRVDGRCIHPALVASGASPPGPPKTKPVTVRRGPSNKTPGPGRPQLQWGALGIPRPPPESGVAPRRPTLAAEAPGRSCSESSLYPVSFFVPLLVARREAHRASAQALFPWEAAPLGASGGVARKRQRRWRSSADVSARARPDPGLGPHRPAARRGGGPRPVCARPRPLPALQDARARSASDGSERSAECASLLLSTAAESSGDEASDHTTSRFGDAESSGSDSGGGRRLGQRARSSSRLALPPVPRLCRVKASKALKRKIRRFQPAALKVMTMV
ncbi:TPA: dapper, antagonist of beta-catenin, homolog 2-like [Bos taurus]|nr:TPA: dapper, antagonist of beta-catenin, homolog 2-like [Bos taurus]